MQTFVLEIPHRAGKLHVNADSVSRSKFDCRKHGGTECTKCVDGGTLDPYLEDQIFNVEGG